MLICMPRPHRPATGTVAYACVRRQNQIDDEPGPCPRVKRRWLSTLDGPRRRRPGSICQYPRVTLSVVQSASPSKAQHRVVAPCIPSNQPSLAMLTAAFGRPAAVAAAAAGPKDASCMVANGGKEILFRERVHTRARTRVAADDQNSTMPVQMPSCFLAGYLRSELVQNRAFQMRLLTRRVPCGRLSGQPYFLLGQPGNCAIRHDRQGAHQSVNSETNSPNPPQAPREEDLKAGHIVVQIATAKIDVLKLRPSQASIPSRDSHQTRCLRILQSHQ